MNNIIFNIKNLKCGYKKSKRPVLEIDELEIEKGKITFFIGSFRCWKKYYFRIARTNE